MGTYAKFTLLGAALLVSALAWGTHVVRRPGSRELKAPISTPNPPPPCHLDPSETGDPRVYLRSPTRALRHFFPGGCLANPTSMKSTLG
jgi:hypothetical protein